MIKKVKFKDLQNDSGFIFNLSGRDQFCIKSDANHFWCLTHGSVIMDDINTLVEADNCRLK